MEIKLGNNVRAVYDKDKENGRYICFYWDDNDNIWPEKLFGVYDLAQNEPRAMGNGIPRAVYEEMEGFKTMIYDIIRYVILSIPAEDLVGTQMEMRRNP